MAPGPAGETEGQAPGGGRVLASVVSVWVLLHLGGAVLVVVDAARIAQRPGVGAGNPALVLWRLSWSVRGAGFMAAYGALAAAVLVGAALAAARPPRLTARALGLSPSGLSPAALVAVLAGGVGTVTAVEACLSTLAGTGRFVAFGRMQAIRDAGWQSYLWLLLILPIAAAAVELLLRGVGQASGRGRPKRALVVTLAILTPVLAPEPFHVLATLALAAYLAWVTSKVGSAGPAMGSHALASGVAVLAVQAYPGVVPMSMRMLLFLGGGVLAFVGVEVVRRGRGELSA